MQKSSSKVVLVADDDPEILSLLRIRLGKAGFEMIEATDGDQALSKAHERCPDLFILDVMMPGRNGWEVAKAIREDEKLRDAGIIVLTAIGERVNEMTSPLYGVDDFIDKPFEFADLEKRIHDVLKKRDAPPAQ